MKSLLSAYCILSERLTRLALVLAAVAVMILTLAMLYEVTARYVFTAPTLWAFDIAYMSNAAIFLLGNAWVLQNRQHIAIRILHDRFPIKVRMLLDFASQIGIIFPLFLLLSLKATHITWRAWQSGEVEMVSPWAPLMWPFYLVFAVGLFVFTLAVPASFLREHVLAATPLTQTEKPA